MVVHLFGIQISFRGESFITLLYKPYKVLTFRFNRIKWMIELDETNNKSYGKRSEFFSYSAAKKRQSFLILSFLLQKSPSKEKFYLTKTQKIFLTY